MNGDILTQLCFFNKSNVFHASIWLIYTSWHVLTSMSA